MTARRILAGVAALALAGVPAAASADGRVSAETSRSASETKVECVAAANRAVELRAEGRLVDARAELVVCGRSECPTIVKADCGRTLVDVDASLASVVFGARDASGRDVEGVSVLVDGARHPMILDGRAHVLDPGPHHFVFLRDGEVAAREQVTLLTGEKYRQLVITVDDAPRASTAPRPAPSSSRFPIVPVTLAGIGLAGLATAGAMHLHMNGRVDDLEATCKPSCSPELRDSLSTELVVSNVALVSGAVALAAAGVTWLFLTPKPVPARR